MVIPIEANNEKNGLNMILYIDGASFGYLCRDFSLSGIATEILCPSQVMSHGKEHHWKHVDIIHCVMVSL